MQHLFFVPFQFSPDSLELSSSLLSDIQKHFHVRIVASPAAFRLPIDIGNMLPTSAINRTAGFWVRLMWQSVRGNGRESFCNQINQREKKSSRKLEKAENEFFPLSAARTHKEETRRIQHTKVEIRRNMRNIKSHQKLFKPLLSFCPTTESEAWKCFQTCYRLVAATSVRGGKKGWNDIITIDLVTQTSALCYRVVWNSISRDALLIFDICWWSSWSVCSHTRSLVLQLKQTHFSIAACSTSTNSPESGGFFGRFFLLPPTKRVRIFT